MNAAGFRHGPLELVSPHFVALIFSGSPTTSALNRKVATYIVKHGGCALWLDTVEDTQLPIIIYPDSADLLQPLVEILPLQLLITVVKLMGGTSLASLPQLGLPLQISTYLVHQPLVFLR